MYTEATWGAGNPHTPYKNLCHVRSQRMKKVSTAKRTEFELVNATLVAMLVPLFDELLTQYQLQKARLE
jgi:hypothetical protein